MQEKAISHTVLLALIRSFDAENGDNYIKQIIRVAEAYLSEDSAQIEKEMSKWQGKVKGNRMSSKETQFIDHNFYKSVRMIIVPDNEMVIDLDNEGFSAISSYTISENALQIVCLQFTSLYHGKHTKSLQIGHQKSCFSQKLWRSFRTRIAETILETSLHSMSCRTCSSDGHNDKELHRGIDSRDNDKSRM